MNRCDQAGRLFGSYWDDEVTQAEREWLESHFTACPGCRQQYEQFARTLETVGSMPRTDVAADLPERALQAARRATAAPDRIAVAQVRPVWIPVTAAAALFLLGVSSCCPARRRPAARSTPRPRGRAASSSPRAPLDAGVAGGQHTATLADSLFDHSEDVEFVLDPVVLHRGRAQAPSRLPKGVQGEQAVISF
jgi:anti-sigma factor RsiW